MAYTGGSARNCRKDSDAVGDNAEYTSASGTDVDSGDGRNMANDSATDAGNSTADTASDATDYTAVETNSVSDETGNAAILAASSAAVWATV